MELLGFSFGRPTNAPHDSWNRSVVLSHRTFIAIYLLSHFAVNFVLAGSAISRPNSDNNNDGTSQSRPGFSRSNSFRGTTNKPAPLDPALMQLSEDLYRLDQSNDAAKENVDWAVNTRSRSGKLFTKLNEAILRSPLYAKFVALLDNYDTQLGKQEVVTALEKQEQSTFLDQVLQTPVMDKAWQFLVSRRLVPASKAEFKDFLNRIWFTIYKRRGQPDTSGFEHVFVGEVDGAGPNAPVSGFHSWIQYYLEEKSGHAVYRRWKGQTEPDVFGMEFTWNGHLKIKSTMAIGESPAMSLAVMTVCFMVAPNSECRLRMAGTPVSVLTHRWDTRNPKEFYVASAYYDN